MTTIAPSVGDNFGFAKLQFEDRAYYMKSYEVSLGRRSKRESADVDLGDQMNVSRKHAVIRYSFERARFELQVLGKNGAFVKGMLVTPEMPPVELKSRDLVQVGQESFFFLLPSKR